MSVAEFSRSYDGIRHLPADVNKLERIGTKTEICKLFCAAIIALNKADETICKQADSLLATNSELLKQCALTRSNYSDQSSSSSSTVNHPNYGTTGAPAPAILGDPDPGPGSGTDPGPGHDLVTDPGPGPGHGKSHVWPGNGGRG